MKSEKKLIVQKTKSKQKSDEEKNLMEVLKIFSPGTSMRTALDDLMGAGIGALIVVDNGDLLNIVDGGFRVNCRFSSQRLVELAKMDGAIILSADLKKILYANTLLYPSIGMSTKETGTRHKAAERTAKQIKTITVAVSERKKKITIYYGNIKHELEKSSEVLRRAAETLQILEKQKEIFNDLIINLNILEISNLVSTNDVCKILQRMEMIRRISEMVRRYLIELGKEGNIVSMRLKELTKNMGRERERIIEDYFKMRSSKVEMILRNIDFDHLVETSHLSDMLFEGAGDRSISPRGLRILNKTNLPEKDIILLINNFGTLDRIFDATEEDLVQVFRNEDSVSVLKESLESLKEKILVGKKL